MLFIKMPYYLLVGIFEIRKATRHWAAFLQVVQEIIQLPKVPVLSIL
jgi:hypothetical protein